MKSWSIILAAVFLLFLTSSKSTELSGAKVGEISPLFELTGENGVVSLQSLRGKYVLVNFWSAGDAQTRINNVFYDRLAKKLNDKFSLISINLDDDRELYGQIVEIDELEANSQFNSEDVVAGDIVEQWHLKNGSRAYLINPQGEIVAINPSENQLTKLI